MWSRFIYFFFGGGTVYYVVGRFHSHIFSAINGAVRRYNLKAWDENEDNELTCANEVGVNQKKTD